MNYGFEIYVDHRGVRLTEALLRPLSAPSGTTLYGLHHPAPSKIPFLQEEDDDRDDFAHAKTSHDMVMTTIPFDLWPTCVAGRFDLRHRPGVLEKALSLVKSYGLNILHLRCTRSGHRYTTVSFVASLVGFGTKDEIGVNSIVDLKVIKNRKNTELPTAESNDDDLKKYVHRLSSECQIIEASLLRKLGNRLTTEHLEPGSAAPSRSVKDRWPRNPGVTLYDDGNTELRNTLHYRSLFDRAPLSIWPLKNLAYFYALAVNTRTRETAVRFEALVADDWSISFKDHTRLDLLTRFGRDLPTVGFASLDTEAHLIRLAILSPSRLQTFRTVDLEFEFVASKERPLPIGSLHALVAKLAPEWNIWRVYNRVHRHDPAENGQPSFSLGKISFILEYDPASSSSNQSEFSAKNGSHPRNISERNSYDTLPSDTEIESSLVRGAPFDEFTLQHVYVRPFTSRKIFISIKDGNQLERAPEILELCKEIGQEFGFLPANVRTVDSYGSPSVSVEAARMIEESSGLIQFLMSDSSESSFTWVETEFFHATVLGLPTVRIIDPRLSGASRFFQDKAAILLPEFASNSRFKSAIRKAFQAVVAKISDTGLPLRRRTF